MTHKVNIVVMLDTNAHSGALEQDYRHIRAAINRAGWGESKKTRKAMKTLLELGEQNFPDIGFTVEQWDTAQLYHEKSNQMLPMLSEGFVARGNEHNDIGRNALNENYRDGHYLVLPPIYGEEEYYNAVAKLLHVLPLEEKEKQRLASWNDMDVIEKASTIQPLFLKYIKTFPKSARVGEYATAFEEYMAVRFNAGEATVEKFLKAFEPDSQERTAFIFVSKDMEALKRVHEARRGRDDKGAFMVFATQPEQFLAMAQQLKRDMYKEIAQEPKWTKKVWRDGHGTLSADKLPGFVETGQSRDRTR